MHDPKYLILCSLLHYIYPVDGSVVLIKLYSYGYCSSNSRPHNSIGLNWPSNSARVRANKSILTPSKHNTTCFFQELERNIILKYMLIKHHEKERLKSKTLFLVVQYSLQHLIIRVIGLKHPTMSLSLIKRHAQCPPLIILILQKTMALSMIVISLILYLHLIIPDFFWLAFAVSTNPSILTDLIPHPTRRQRLGPTCLHFVQGSVPPSAGGVLDAARLCTRMQEPTREKTRGLLLVDQV